MGPKAEPRSVIVFVGSDGVVRFIDEHESMTEACIHIDELKTDRNYAGNRLFVIESPAFIYV